MPADSAQKLYSVGAVARDTGLREDTLRIWERRYGEPKPIRLPSGHRRYSHDQLLRLRQIAGCMALGHRPGKLLKLGEQELQAMLAASADEQTADDLGPYLAAIDGFQSMDLRSLLESSLRQMGLLTWLEELVAPLVAETGHRWAKGQFSVQQEHFFSQVLRSHLQAEFRLMNPQPGRLKVVLATLPDERHGLGLHMAALVIASHGFDVRNLGEDLPTESLLQVQQQTESDVVGLSISTSSGGPATDRLLQQIRDQLPKNCRLLVGGEGARGNRRGIRGIDYLGSLRELDHWCMSQLA